jgi:succinate dehydrogenase / fumarate reductase, cytochrome b subunit
MLNGLITTVTEGVRYRGGIQHWLWLLHRLTGLGVLLFLITHVFGMSMSFFNPHLHEIMLETYKTPLFSLGELALAGALIIHSVNGTRIALLELKPDWWNQQKKAQTWALIVTAALILPTVLIMAYKSAVYMFGGGAAGGAGH